jgi:GNAT superfamily N-acetyltransferase
MADVHVRCWQETYTGQLSQDYLDSLTVEQRLVAWTNVFRNSDWPSTGTFVLIDNAVLVGFASVCPSRDEDALTGTGELAAIYVRRVAWGRGGGRALMTAGLATLATAGFESATVWVLDSNGRACRFYEKAGFRWDKVDRVDSLGGRQVREIRYRRPLP